MGQNLQSLFCVKMCSLVQLICSFSVSLLYELQVPKNTIVNLSFDISRGVFKACSRKLALIQFNIMNTLTSYLDYNTVIQEMFPFVIISRSLT